MDEQAAEQVDSTVRCSARGCRNTATDVIDWRNPGIHTGGRVKQWAACGEHVGSLSDFLARRGFLLGSHPVR